MHKVARFVLLNARTVLLRLLGWMRFPGWLWTRWNLLRNQRRAFRCLDIGPGKPLPGFENLNIVLVWRTHYVCDAAKRLPFSDNSFDIIHASHVLEHIPWYNVEAALHEWIRVLKPGGHLEVWVPDGLKICKAFVDAELHGQNYIDADGWYRLNPERDPCKWASGRIFTYGDGCGTTNHPNWHRALFSNRFLRGIFVRTGFTDIREMEPTEVRGSDHGWINLGMKGAKPP